MNVTLEFGGGAELLFNKVMMMRPAEVILSQRFPFQQKQHKVSLPDKPPTGEVWRIQELLYWVRGLIIISDPDIS